LPADRIIAEKKRQLDRIIQNCIGLTIETTIDHAEVVPGESIKLNFAASLRSTVLPVQWKAVQYPSTGLRTNISSELTPFGPLKREPTQTISAKTPLTQPYWLREPGTVGLFHVDDPTLIGQPQNPPAFPIEHVFEVGGQTLIIPDEPMQVITEASKAENRRR